MMPKLIALIPLLALLVWAAAEDLRSRRIPNWISLALAAGGLLNSFISPAALVTPSQAGLGVLIGFAIPFTLFALGALGAGDVKLLSGIGAWIGATGVFEVFIVEAIVGLLIILVQCAWQRRIVTLFRNSAVLAVNLVHISDLGVAHVSETGNSCRSIDRPLPFAVPVLLATLIVVTLL